MAEVLGLAASIIAVLQASEAVIQSCKSYIESVKNYPSDLRKILLEISNLKGVFENLQFLHDNDLETSQILSNIIAKDGAIEGCGRVVLELQRQFPTNEESVTTSTEPRSSKRRKVKDSLERLAWPFKENKVRGLLNELHQYKSTITTAFSAELVHDVKYMHKKVQDISKTIDEASKNSFRQWLWCTNPSSNHNSARAQHEPGTCKWVLQLPQWVSWLNQELRCLWIHGIPGAGKTVLSSQLVDEITSCVATPLHRRIGTVYYYCYHARNQDETAPFLRWILGQLSKQADMVPEDIYTNYQNGYEPTISQLLVAIEDVLSCFDVVFISLDAIDESQPRDSLLKTISEFMSDPRFSKLQLLATSREYADIQNTMRQLPNSFPISMANESLRSDIQIYISRTLAEERPFCLWRTGLRDEVENLLAAGSKGMFRWVICQIDLLRRMRLASEDDVRAAILSLPVTLDETYERILLLIREEDRTYVRSTLHWILFLIFADVEARQSLDNLTRLVFPPWERSTSSYANEIDWEKHLLDICGCLIRRDVDGDVILAHYTVREFLESSRIIDSPISFFAVDRTKLIKEYLMVILDERPKRRKKLENDQTTTRDAPVDYILALELILFTDITEPVTNQMVKDETLFRCFVGFIASARFYPSPDIEGALGDNDPTWAAKFWFADMVPKNMDESFICGLRDDEVDPDTFVFISLILLFPKAIPKFLSTANRRKLYQQHIVIHTGHPQYKSLDSWLDDTSGEHSLSLTGNVFEILGQIQAIGFGMDDDAYGILCDEGVGLFNPTSIFCTTMEYLNMPTNNKLQFYNSRRILNTFIRLGANLNFTDRPLTILQLAVATAPNGYDSGFVGLLLDHGANPNDVGQGDAYFEEHLIELNSFRGQSPLRICRNLMWKGGFDNSELGLEYMEQFLQNAGGRNFFEPPR